MFARIAELPFLVVLIGIGGIAMLIPAAHAAAIGDIETSRVFFYSGLLVLIVTGLLVISTLNYQPARQAPSLLVGLLAAFLVLPAVLAFPIYEIVAYANYLDAWFEMVSAMTTTGATVFDAYWLLPPSVHLWRGLVAWMGGLLFWICALAIFAPMSIGGFEIRDRISEMSAFSEVGGSQRVAPSDRLRRISAALTPLYVGLTVVLWIAPLIAGEAPNAALVHAMSTLSTSGISAVGGFYRAESGLVGEILVFVFFVFALSRLTYSRGLMGEERTPLWQDSELRLGLTLAVAVSLSLFARHFIGAFDAETTSETTNALRAFWGGLFTVTSFLTTTGFESAEWLGATDWSGLSTPGLMLVGLSLIGGGIATTAGGVKLLRVYALMKHGERELERLVHPSSIGGAGQAARRIRREGAYVAWIFFMLFALSIAATIVLLSLFGVQFETAMVLTVAVLSTTGPLAEIAGEAPIAFSGLPDPALVVLSLAMILGRLEALAIIAMFNPEFWRR